MTIQQTGSQPIYTTQQVQGTIQTPAQEPLQEVAPGAPFDVMQAKQGLDIREEAYRAIVQAEAEAALDARQDKITDEELKQIFGDQADAVRTLLNKRSDVNLSELLPLRNDPNGLAQVLRLLTERTDLAVSDLIHKTPDGKVKIDGSVTDDECKELMAERTDIKPKAPSALKATILKAFGNPVLAKKAFTMAVKLLKTRTDLSCESVGKMIVGICEQLDTIKPPGGSAGLSAGAAKLEMLEVSVNLLTFRRDLGTEDVVNLARATVQTFGDKRDPMSFSRVTRSFAEAADLLVSRPGMSVSQVTGFMKTLKQVIPGRDANALDTRASIFSSACNLLKQRQDLDFSSIDELLKRQTWGEKKKGNALLRSFNEATSDLGKGKNIDDVAAPVTHGVKTPAGRSVEQEQKVKGEPTRDKEAHTGAEENAQ